MLLPSIFRRQLQIRPWVHRIISGRRHRTTPGRLSGSLLLLLVVACAALAEPGESVDSGRSQEQQASDAERALDTFLRDQKILLRKGEFEFEVSLLNTTDTRKNARIGALLIPSVTVYRTTVSFTTRYALTNRLELSVQLPYNYDDQDYDFQFLESVDGIEDIRSEGPGDVRLGLRYQIPRKNPAAADLAVALDYKADTADGINGTGDQSVGISTTWVQTIDPVVFFTDLGYSHALEQDGADRGDALTAQFGTGFSLNDRVSYSVRTIVHFNDKTSYRGDSVAGTDQRIVSLEFGATHRLRGSLYLEPFLNFGLTDDAADVTMGLNMPF